MAERKGPDKVPPPSLLLFQRLPAEPNCQQEKTENTGSSAQNSHIPEQNLRTHLPGRRKWGNYDTCCLAVPEQLAVPGLSYTKSIISFFSHNMLCVGSEI